MADVFFFVAGLVLLVGGAELLVRGASRLALAFGVSPLVIGLTIVAYGTSAPEVAVSVRAVLSDQGALALGNVVGSNVFNVLVILGLSAVIVPLVVDRQVVQREVPILVGVSGLVVLMALDGRFGRVDGVILLAGAVGYTIWTVWQSRKEVRVARESAIEIEAPEPAGPAWKSILLGLVGLALLVLGARWLVDSAVVFARALGVSELVIGLTIVAAGTSLPEVATSVVAAVKGQRDLAVGNVVGSNLFNLLVVLGAAGATGAAGVPVGASALTFDIPIMVAVSVACVPIFFTDHRVDRWEGGVFLAYYVVYVVYLIFDATRHWAVDELEVAMTWFVIPLTVLTLVVTVWHEIRAKRRREATT